MSHPEWGDATGTKAILMESANPAQGRLRGPTNEALIVEGADRYYTRAAELGLLYVPFGEEGSPLDERVGRHLQMVSTLLGVFSSHNPDRTITVEHLPTLDDLLQNGLGVFLADVRYPKNRTPPFHGGPTGPLSWLGSMRPFPLS